MQDGCSAITCMGVFVALIATIVLAAQNGRVKNLNRVYRRAAEHLRGSAQEGKFWRRPSLLFVYQGVPIIVDIFRTGQQGKREYTRLQAPWPDPHVRCDICPRRFLSGVMRFFAAQDIKTGFDSFDSRYLVTGKDPDQVRQLISPGVQAAIDALRQLTYNDDVQVAFMAGRLYVRKQGLISHYETLLQFIHLALEVYDQAAVVQSGAIEFLDSSRTIWLGKPDPNSGENVVCRICLEEIGQDVVYCRTCKTPHHADCWSYFGACSTYGCGQTKFIRPQ